jgi:hypothetical protein
MAGPSGWRFGAVVYWLCACALTLFGFLAALSIGAPFLLVGLTMIVVWPLRKRPQIMWPVLAGVTAFSAVFLLAAPIECSRSITSSAAGEEEEADCPSIAGIHYSGTGDYEPSFLPAVLAGLGAAGVAAASTRALVVRSHRVEPA